MRRKRKSDLGRRAASAYVRLLNVRMRLKRIHTELGDMPSIQPRVTDAYSVVAIAFAAVDRAAVMLKSYADDLELAEAAANANVI